jgi:hypothetical protein
MVKQTALQSMGFKLINNDAAFEKYLQDAGLDPADPDVIASPQGQKIRDKANRITKSLLAMHLGQKLGLVIDGTGKDYAKISKQAQTLRKLGYEVGMIFVNTDLETAINRNKSRERGLPDPLVTSMWKDVQNNIGRFHNFFGRNMFVVDNSEGSDTNGVILNMYKRMQEFADSPHTSPVAKNWIKKIQGK